MVVSAKENLDKARVDQSSWNGKTARTLTSELCDQVSVFLPPCFGTQLGYMEEMWDSSGLARQN